MKPNDPNDLKNVFSPVDREGVKIEDRQLTAGEFEEVLWAFYLKGYQRGACDPKPIMPNVEKSFQNELYFFGLKTKP